MDVPIVTIENFFCCKLVDTKDPAPIIGFEVLGRMVACICENKAPLGVATNPVVNDPLMSETNRSPSVWPKAPPSAYEKWSTTDDIRQGTRLSDVLLHAKCSLRRGLSRIHWLQPVRNRIAILDKI